MSNLPSISVSEIQQMAVAIAKSGLFGMRNPEQAMALMLIAQAEGMHPAIAARDFHVIQGKPALKADAMLARFQQAGGKVEWLKYDDKEVSAKFSHPQGGAATIVWTIAQAAHAGLTSKDVWKQYPRAMLRARVISEGVKTVFPGVAVGVYTPEEINDFDTKPPATEVTAEVSAPAEPTPAAKAPVIVTENKEPAGLSDAMKRPFYARLKQSTWTKEQLAEFARGKYGKSDATKLSLGELTDLVNVATSSSFEEAFTAALVAESNE